MDDRVEADGASAPLVRGPRYGRIVALLMVVVGLAALFLLQRPDIEREQTRDQAVTISEEFVEAYGTGNHDDVMSLVSSAAEISINPARSPEDFGMAIAWMEATGWTLTVDRCTASVRFTEARPQRVLCYLVQEDAWSRALELAPHRLEMSIDIASDRVVGASLSSAPMSFRTEAVISFESWLLDNHPSDEEQMYQYFGLPALTDQSIALWSRYTDEFVAKQSS